jgi:hypothetical protein
MRFRIRPVVGPQLKRKAVNRPNAEANVTEANSLADRLNKANAGPTNPPLANCFGYCHRLVCHRHDNVDFAYGLGLPALPRTLR